QARSKAELTRQEMLAEQNKAKVEAETSRIQAVIQAEQELSVKITRAQRELEVARLENQAAEAQAQAILAKAEGDRDVVRLDNLAQSGVLKAQSQAFPSGMALARYGLYHKIGPRIGSILASDTGTLGSLFTPYLSAPEQKP
ncbi:MAG: hypothetical protein WCP34_07580, partial [Pseudomonadota bacterium]